MKANINRINHEHYNALLKKEAFYRAEANMETDREEDN